MKIKCWNIPHLFSLKRRTTFLWLALFLAGPLAGCATDSKGPSAVATTVRRIDEALHSITESYEKKDEKSFFSGFDPAFKFLAPLKNQVLRDFETFSEIDVTITIDRVEIEGELISAAVHWGGVWKSSSQGRPLEKKGHALFTWKSGEAPKLLEIRGDPPFGVFRGGI